MTRSPPPSTSAAAAALVDGAWLPDREAATVSFEGQRLVGEDGTSRVSLALSLTAAIGQDVIAAAGKDANVYEIRPEGVACGRQVLDAPESLANFAAAYHRLLATIEEEHPTCTELEIFPACPASAAVAVGRGAMRTAQPALVVYDRADDGSFRRALDLR